jgi:hypothetical protein
MMYSRVQLGKMDFVGGEEYQDWMWRHKSRNAPITHHKVAHFFDFFLKVRLVLCHISVPHTVHECSCNP